MNINERIDRLIDLTARVESGGDYSAWNPDDNGHGPSFGLIQFSSTVGSLGKLIVAMQQAHPEWFRLIFGAVEMEPGEWGKCAARSPHLYRPALQLSGQVPVWQQCQRQLAREEYFDPAWRVLQRIQNAGRPILVSERAAAMAFDISVQCGVGGLGEKLRRAVDLAGSICTEKAILDKLADLADTHEYDANRRHKLLNSPELSDAPLFDAPPPTETRPTLRRYSYGPEVIELREALESTGNLPPDRYSGSPTFSYAVEKAVKAFQAEHGLTVDGVVGPATWRALDEAAKGGKP